MSWEDRGWEMPEEFRRMGKDPRSIAKIVGAVIGVIVLLALAWSSYYTVQANEQAVLLRFGRDAGIREPGLHFKLPFGVDTVWKVAVKEVKREEFGFRTEQPGVKTVYREGTPVLRDESRMLTGDLNILNLQWVVRYRVDNIRNYFFNVRNPAGTLRDVSEAVMRLVVGDSSVDEALTIGRVRIQQEAKEKIQQRLDGYEAGIHVVNVRLKDVSPPEDVKDAFNEVNRARQEKETIINQAKTEVNSKIPEAKGKKQRTIEEARGYAEKRVNEAEGDVARFNALLREYTQAPEVTARRLYLETMSEQLPRLEKKYILDSSAGQVLKLLDLKKPEAGKGGQQ